MKVLQYILAAVMGLFLSAGLIAYGISFLFGGNYETIQTPRGPNQVESRQMSERMSKYHHPHNLYRLMIRGQQ